MERSHQRRRRRSKQLREQEFPISLFGQCVVLAAGGIKPAAWLAEKAGCSERFANLIIAGKRVANARAIHALNASFLEEADRLRDY